LENWVSEVLDPAHVAIVIVDVQHDFLAPDGKFAQNGADISGGRRVLRPLNALLAAGRSAGVKPVYLRFVEDPFGHVVSQVYDRQRYAAGRELRYCLDKRGQTILPEVAPMPSDPVVDKVRASGFFNTPLDTILRCASIQTIVLTGVATDSCVLATAIDATARDYYVVVASDCVASFDEARHEAALRLLAFKHPTATSGELMKVWATRSHTKEGRSAQDG
jgi:nicotinamidase-related amidase